MVPYVSSLNTRLSLLIFVLLSFMNISSAVITTANLKSAHVGSTNPGFTKGTCPASPDGYLYGWHFILQSTTTSFLSINATFKNAGSVTKMVQSPTDKHAYVFTPKPDTLLAAQAIVNGSSDVIILSHVCSGTDPCNSNNGGCGLRASCIYNTSISAVNCTCNTGYVNTGSSTSVNCTDACLKNNGGCGLHASCAHDSSTYAVKCSCDNGYINTGSGSTTNCTDACRQNNGGCGLHASCAHDSSTYAVKCSCDNGYINTGSGSTTNCTDACLQDNGGCGLHASCSHDSSTYAVKCTCDNGYINTGSGSTTNCTALPVSTVASPAASCEIDNGGCGQHATCAIDVTTKIIKCKCLKGFTNTGIPPVTNCTDSCLVNNGGCGSRATCMHDATSFAVKCICKTGFTNTGTEFRVNCTDSCQVNNGGCGPHSSCIHIGITYDIKCLCDPGYNNVGTESSVSCVPHESECSDAREPKAAFNPLSVNICEIIKGECQPSAACIMQTTTNTDSCKCKSGYTNVGSGTTVICSKIPLTSGPVAYDENIAPTNAPKTTPAPINPPKTTPAPVNPPKTTLAPINPPKTTPAPINPPKTTPAPINPPKTTPAPTTLAPGTQKAYLKAAHIGAQNPGFSTGACPASPNGYRYGWHFILSGSTTSFVSINVTFKKAGVVTSMIQVPTNKHAYVFTPTADTLLGASAVVSGPATEFVLSHICTPTA